MTTMNDFLKDVIQMLAEEEGKDYSDQFTFADLIEYAWENEPFDTKEQAIEAAKEMFPNGFAIGRLQDNGINYDVVDVEEFRFN
ncbi:hypothetical protein H9635_10150 [Solibacillus sp. A46]|uniref:Uncharacterized protein n=1 Tax=Solibacillus faecavium TaxID=2762221 RepID=A0ABR8XYV9_9BACL|nr:hypothetical protein [Solibacillus faecavium]MBD8037107.1 hypothetical protein [Solibacillus faecavium]